MQDIHAALESIYLKMTLMDVSLQLNIVFKGGWDANPSL